MNTQLDLLSPIYYSTFGYDLELADYISFIEDEFIRKLFPRFGVDSRGRRAYDPVVLFRMHFLYFTRPEFVSFRQMCRELKKLKHQDYRNFLGIYGLNVPSHSALSRFRKELGIDDRLDELNKEVLNQAQKLDGFLNLMIGSLDSRPIFASVGGFKKECVCGNPDQCNCPPRFSDPDATTGRQRTKVNQARYFVGYRKNTLVSPSSQGPMPLSSVVVNAKVSDQKALLPSLKRLEKAGITLPYLIADMGYIGGEDKVTALKEFSTVVVTETRKNMIPPEVCDETGRIVCPEGHVTQLVDFDREQLRATYCGNAKICSTCFRNGVCSKEFTYSFEEEPQFFGPIMQNSAIQEQMLQFRKQVELNFAIESNLLDTMFRHKKIPVKGQRRIETYLRLADLFRLIMGMIHHTQKNLIPKHRDDYVKKLAEKEVSDWNLAQRKVA